MGDRVSDSTSAATIDVDALVIGAGFGGIYALYKLRQMGLSAHILEAGRKLGGVWYWNQYPGARVDSEFPLYQLTIPELYRDWQWTQRFPGFEELRRYFAHIDKVLDISKDTTFGAEVIEARFNENTLRWTVTTKQGHTGSAKYLILCTGSTYKRYYPDWKGLRDYRGALHHSGHWPSDSVDVVGKSVAVIGAGATAVQVVQELGKSAASLTNFIRTPNTAFPMRQRPVTEAEQNSWKGMYDTIFKASRKTYGGFINNAPPGSFATTSPDERVAWYERLYATGGFSLVTSVWDDWAFNPESNRSVYDFWAQKTRARISDPVKRDILAPLEPRHPFACKRPSLEQDYYEIIDQPNVSIVDLDKTGLSEFTPEGIKTEDGKHRKFDVIVLATGYDNYTGAFSTMGIKDVDGVDLRDRWQEGVKTYIGLQVSKFPNMFMSYGPHAPTALGNGPTIIEVQLDVVMDIISKMQSEHISSLVPTLQAENEWSEGIQAVSKLTLMPLANSWYMGANIPGKKREMLNYLKGLATYDQECRAAFEDGWKGFDVVKEEAVLKS